MQRLGKGNSDLWDRLDAEQTDSEFLKTASFDVEESGELASGPRIPAGFLMKTAGVEVRDVPIPDADAPEWAHEEYRRQVKEASLKMAGFWGDALENLGKTIRGILRGAPDPTEVKDILKADDVVKRWGKGVHKGTARVDVKALQKALKSSDKARDALAGKYRLGQMAFYGGLPLMGVAAGQHFMSKDKLRRQHAAVEHHLLAQPEFENLADKEQAIGEGFGLMRRYAPTIAADPIVAKSFVTMLVNHDDLQNLEIIQNLMEAEKKYRDKGEFARDWHDISRLVRHPMVSPFMGAKGG